MSKNLTRKGLALGALVALGSSVIAGAPAQAANELTFTPKLGTAFAMPITDTFTFTAGLPSGSTGNIAQLKYKVSTAGALTVNAVSSVKLANASVVNSAVDATPGDLPANNVSTGVKAVTSAAAGYVSGQADVVATTVVDGATNDTYAHTYTVPTSTSQNTLAISLGSAAATSTTQTVVVTAFLDSDGSGTLNGSEWSTEQTVTFVKYSELTVSGSITAPVAGDSKVTGKFQFTNANNEQIQTAVKAKITLGDGTGISTDAAADTTSAITWSATDLFKAEISDANSDWALTGDVLAKGTAVKVQPILGSTNVGTAFTADVATRKLATWTADTVTSKTAAAATAALNVAATDVAVNSEFQVEFEGLDATPAAVAGVPVTIKVTSPDATLSSTKTIAINGTTYSSNAALPGATGVAELAAVTDAKGKVTVTIKATGLSDGNDIRVYATAENFVADIITNQADAAFTTSYVENAPFGVATTTDGAAVALSVVVKDQFGNNAPDSTYMVAAAWDAADVSYSAQTTAASTAATAVQSVVSAGKAALTITDNGTGTGVNNYDITLQKKSAVTGLYADVATIVANFNVKIVSAADAAAGKVVLTASAGGAALDAASTTDSTYVLGATVAGGSTGPGDPAARTALSTSAFGSYDSRNVIDTLPANTTYAVTVYGTVKSTSTTTYAGAAIANSKVTISGAGLGFKATGQGTVHGDGTLTIYANASGQFSFTAASHLAGKQTVTVTSGAGSSKIYLYFAEALEANASSVAVKVADGSSQFQAGRALDVTFTVTDKYGNPVNLGQAVDSAKLTISQTGAGYLTLSGDQATGAAGTFASKLITNFGDLGTSTITATVDFSDTTKTDLVASKSSEFGVTDADVTVGGRAVYASVEFAKGKSVSVSVDGVRLYSKLQATDNYTELKFTQKKAGKHVVTIRVSGGVSVTETVVTTK